MLPHFNLQKIAKKVEIELFSHDLHSKETKKIKEKVAEIAETLGKPSLRGPMVAISQEFLANGLKAVYKKIYFENVIPKIQMGELSYETKLHLFRIEIDSHQTKNFVHIAKENNSYVSVKFHTSKEGLALTVRNPGTPSGTEMHRIKSTLENAKKLLNLSYIFDDDNTQEEESQKEGAGLGISLIVMTLRNLGIPLNNLDIYTEENMTYSRVLFPWGFFFDDSSEEVSIIKGSDLNKETIRVINNLSYYMIRFNSKGSLLSISDNFVKNYGLSTKRSSLMKMIPNKFFDDFFGGIKNISTETKIDHYYLKLNFDDKTQANDGNEQTALFHISAFFNKDSTVTSIWRPIPKSIEDKFSPLIQEKFVHTLKLQEFLRPYISTGIITKAEEIAQEEETVMSEELKSVTLFFADLVGFTKRVESVNPKATMNLFNIALGILVKAIETQRGYVDKFMGDSVMAIFDNPLSAIIAAVEIQTLFAELNKFRALSEENLIYLRIGIHSGEVLMGDVGPRHRKDWTVVGDVVNIASRLERSAPQGSVLISKDTFDLTKESVTFKKKGKLKAKNKEIHVYFVQSVTFMKYGREVTLHIKEVSN